MSDRAILFVQRGWIEIYGHNGALVRAASTKKTLSYIRNFDETPHPVKVIESILSWFHFHRWMAVTSPGELVVA